jgi:hypothetical protein
MQDNKVSRQMQGHLSEILNDIRSSYDSEESCVKVADLLSALGDKSILSAMLLPALIAATPLSGIPGLSAVCGLLIALLSFELIFNFRRIYLPEKLQERSIDAGKLDSTLEKLSPAIKWIDRHSQARLKFLFHRPMIWLPQLLCLVSGLAMPLLEFIPFSASVAATGATLLIISMLTEDGIFFLLAMFPYAFGIYLIV